jgi:hypothetical protein
MKIIESKFFPPLYIINLFGILFVRSRILRIRYAQFLYIDPYTEQGMIQARIAYAKLKRTQSVLKMIIGAETLNEERIHTAQMREWLYIGFYIAYLMEWIVTGFRYESISFEREAKENAHNLNYLNSRKRYANYRKETRKSQTHII